MDAYQLQQEAARLAEAEKLANLMLANIYKNPGNEMMDTGYGMKVANWGTQAGNMLARPQIEQSLLNTGVKKEALAQAYRKLYGEDAARVAGFLSGPNADVSKAIAHAYTSQFPEVQKQAGELVKGIPTPVEYLKQAHNLDPASMQEFQRTGQPGSLKPAQKLDIHNDVAISSQGGIPTGRWPVQSFGEVTQEPVSGLSTQTSNVTGKTTALAGGNVTPERNMRNLTNAAVVKDIEESAKDAKTARQNLQVIGQIQTDLPRIPDKALGTWAPFRNWYSRFTELFGARPVESVKGIEILNSNLGNLMLQDIRKLAPVTEQDIQQIQTIIGSVGLSKRGLTEIMEIAARRNMQILQEHENKAKAYGQIPGGEGTEGYWNPPFTTSPVARQGEQKTVNWNDLN